MERKSKAQNRYIRGNQHHRGASNPVAGEAYG